MRRFFNARIFSQMGWNNTAIDYLKTNDDDTTQVITDLAAHIAAADPHPVYLTATEGNAAYAPIGKGVTNGDSHDHNGGDGGVIAATALSAGNWKVLYSNGSGAVVELALGASGFLKSNGASAAPTFSAVAHSDLSGIDGGTYHVVAPQAAITDAVGGDEVTKINAILAVMRTHGLISP